MNKQEFEQRAMASGERLHRIGLSMLASEADCEDAVQDALVRAWMGISRLKEPRYFETWLCRILINECKRMLRRRKIHFATEEMAEMIPAAPTPDPGLWDTLKGLEVHYRLPLVLHHVEGYSVKECAEMLSLPQSTVKWRIHQGKQALKTLLGEGEEA